MSIWCSREYTLYQCSRRYGFIGAISCPSCVQHLMYHQIIPPVHDDTAAHILLQCPQHDSQRQQLINVYMSHTQWRLDNIILSDETILNYVIIDTIQSTIIEHST